MITIPIVIIHKTKQKTKQILKNANLLVTTEHLTLFYRPNLLVKNDKCNDTSNADHVLASFIRYTPSPITNLNIKKME